MGAPLTIGWIVQVLLASWTHLLPSIGPGTPVQHGLQRTILGRFATPRLLALNGGVALLAIGWPLGLAWAAAGGGALVAVAVVATVALAAEALQAGR